MVALRVHRVGLFEYLLRAELDAERAAFTALGDNEDKAYGHLNDRPVERLSSRGFAYQVLPRPAVLPWWYF